ncbi:sensor histidine kinase [Nitrosophilus alvini]|uniref:sensor histidine kinase n=1 Tax=Nitrosophilus alvini TaxID=2714855 RepID=UPI00190D0BC1|nr:HAMP domain-containing sensor histidine kinase [Nitrosophilus alvini]
MKTYEKKAFWKFFAIYFASVAILITVSGYFYFQQQKETFISKEQFSMILYARMLKTSNFNYKREGFTYEILKKEIKNFNPQNLKLTECCFEKIVPNRNNLGYLLIKKDRKEFDENIKKLLLKIIVVEFSLLFLFGVISFYLSKLSLKPMQETIKRLDWFAKDLIHDLNTPVTSILLNIKLLKKDPLCKGKKELSRIETSTKEIASLYKNLNILLEEKTFKMEKIDICPLIKEMAEEYSLKFRNIKISVECKSFEVKVNSAAIKQILHNLLTNACKYNVEGGSVKIWTKNRTLYIKDTGKGIENVDLIFKRYYKEQKSGSGIGLHIVKTLCDAMDIEIEAESKKNFGTVVMLSFP